MKETLEPKIKKPKKRLSKIILLLISYVIVAVIVWKFTLKTQESTEYQQEQARKQVEVIVKKVSRIAVLPTSETPQIAVIQDVDILKKNQDFFIDAQNGDKILVYAQARKAIIYRESEDKIVNIALNIGAENTATQAEPEKTAVEVEEKTTEATSTER